MQCAMHRCSQRSTLTRDTPRLSTRHHERTPHTQLPLTPTMTSAQYAPPTRAPPRAASLLGAQKDQEKEQKMAKRAKPEEIIAKLREAEVRLSQGESVGMAAKSIGVTEQTYYRWRKEYGGLQVNQAKRLKDMEKENARLRKAISDLMLDKQILEEVIKGKF